MYMTDLFQILYFAGLFVIGSFMFCFLLVCLWVVYACFRGNDG